MKLTTETLTDVTRNRFWIKVDKRGPDECWPWLGANNGRYGTMTINKRTIGAHKVSYLIHHGDTPDGVMILHECDEGLCVNPAHLCVGSHAKNMRDKAERGSHRGERVWHLAKLTNPGVKLIRRCFEDGHYDCQRLSDITGVTYQTIWSILNDKTWRHVDADGSGRSLPSS